MNTVQPALARPSTRIAQQGLSLQVENLQLTYDQQLILSIYQLEITPGELVVMTGPSGSGKSSFLHLICGLLPPSKGEVRWGGETLSALPERKRDLWRQQNLGMIFQDFHLIPGLSALENVLLPLTFVQWRIAAEQRAQAEALLNELGVDETGRLIGQYSRGQKQRIALARALFNPGTVLLADEPTASLDQPQAAAVLELLRSKAHQGYTVLAVSHDPILVGQADRLLTLDRGVLA